MTNPTFPDRGATFAPGPLALAPGGGRRRPVKVVEHRAFGATRAALNPPFAELRPPLASLNLPAASAGRACTTAIEAA